MAVQLVMARAELIIQTLSNNQAAKYVLHIAAHEMFQTTNSINSNAKHSQSVIA